MEKMTGFTVYEYEKGQMKEILAADIAFVNSNNLKLSKFLAFF